MKLWHKVFIGLILGLFFGIYLPQHVEFVKPIGTVFLRLIKMVIVPLLFFSLLSGITGMRDPSSIGRVAKKSVLAYFGTTCFAVIFGLGVAQIMQPGSGLVLDLGPLPESNFRESSFDIINFLIEVVPSNIFVAFADSNILQVVFFSIFTGVIINSMGSSVDPLREFIQSAAKLVLKMIAIIVELSPYAAFALTAWVVGTQGLDIMMSLGKLVVAITIAYILQYLIFGLFIIVFCRLSPIPFYKKSIEYQMIAISTGSSKASLATTMQVCRQKLGVSETSTSFVLPLGASINMDGLAIKLGISVMFFAQIMGVQLGLNDYMVIIITGTLGSIGGAGIPGSFIIMLPIMLTSVGLPIEGVALLVGIDRVLDLFSTAINITGDATITLVVDSTEGTLDRDMYNSD
ncbi:MAG: dicarboxylate/amino acid:cation symporter [Rickettsiaceae bacterium]|nr:dicarboxylate/amino acid:cation symporter [Rickettsiaceae bacterium]MDP4832256.1 dicarboxylate/amino acid:cation symporter [Rickettsiaceae bacterium]MDP5021187.1 dicarboxylate/amino acid:cation symporter [Rickettsiaceae bacterium]MDP5083574.1 dicarboxylate/amino acid:cation symporter [Rickettsiaceae bacterium]